MLAEGLKRRSASRTLERAVGEVARRSAPRAHDTRSFTDAVIELLPQRAPTSSTSTRCGRRMTPDARLRRDPALARSRRSRRRVRNPRRRDPADLRRDRARTTRAARARPPRAGRRPHGRGLRARVGQGRRRDRDLRAGRDEPRHADRRRVDGLHAARLHHRPGQLEPDRHRRVPGDRRHRHHDADRQALVARPGRRGVAAA